MSMNVLTLGQLFKQDMEKAFLFPVFPSSSLTNSKFVNKADAYRVFDYPPFSTMFRDVVFPQALSCTAGNEIPVLTDYPPPDFLKQHWKTWLPVFPLPNFISTDEGLKEDGIPIVTTGAFQDIPKSKHSVDPDVLHWLQLKSSIPEIGVPHPRYMDEDNVEFPCVVKVDLSYSGIGVYRANNSEELASLVNDIREKHGWKRKIIYQELIQNIKRAGSYLFYLAKTKEVVWLGSHEPVYDGFEYIALNCDWNKQEEERQLVYDEFVMAVAHFLHRSGYFGLVNFETIENDNGAYLVDLNPRLPGGISHHLMAPYMSSIGLAISELHESSHGEILSGTKLVDTANQLNEIHNGRVIIQSASFADEESHCPYQISIFAETRETCQKLWKMLTMN